MKIINTEWDGEKVVIAEIMSNHSMTLDEAINMVGRIIPESENENVEINGEYYYYDDLSLEN